MTAEKTATSPDTSAPDSSAPAVATPASGAFLDAVRGRATDHVPVWLMRQAGRYLPEYRNLKERHGFWEMCRTPELAAEITLQPLRRFPLDAAIIFNDIVTPLPAMGMEVEFAPEPVLARPLRTRAAIEALRRPDAEEIAPFVAAAIRQVRSAVSVPVIGFAGAPLTIAMYAVQGRGSKDYAEFRGLLRQDPDAARALLGRIADVTADYLRQQVAAGVSAVQLFDSWAGMLSPDDYREFGLPFARRVLAAVADVPRIYLAVGASHLYPLIATLPTEVVSVDWRLPLSRCRPLLPGKVLQGNLDPASLLADRAVVRAHAHEVLRQAGGRPHVFNLGHGVLPSTPPDNVACLVDEVRAYRPEQPPEEP
ncbi:uroporphyrinogen decarboxylase [Streptoalloteichus hindustanus]|uniref:Uroporphyrinogen decarboxylase n=1 Tax=Streptoalloteichus hindustanus TaxID=2017 RepID=A0A1M5PRB3_STRHI|nr:uroporphyrinogen decarboxylase [Streptoalloteichus hindustanus]SHH03863.1 uroporphyrinogen decarboxylase [Streptoalloteichus hindustanus]